MRVRLGVAAAVGLLLALAAGAAGAAPVAGVASRVELLNGRVLAADSVRVEGDELVLGIGGGTLRVLRSRVARVVSATPGQPTAPAGFNVLPGPAPPPPPPPPGVYRGSVTLGAARRSERAPGAAFDGVDALAGRPDETRLREALVAGGRRPEVLVALGALLVDQARYQEALSPLTEAGSGLTAHLQEQRDLALARALSRLDRVDEALAVLKDHAGDPGGDVATLRARLQEDRAQRAAGEVLRSAHFVVHAPEGTSAREAQALLSELERAHARLARELGAAPREPLVVVLYAGDEFWESTGRGATVVGLYDGKVRVPAGRLDPPTPRLVAVLAHETTHAFVHALSAGRAGAWWQEGLAEHFEGTDISRARPALAELASRPGAWPPPASHAAAHSRFEHVLSRWGVALVRDFLAALARGESEDAALRRLVGLDRAGLDEDWRLSLQPGRARR